MPRLASLAALLLLCASASHALPFGARLDTLTTRSSSSSSSRLASALSFGAIFSSRQDFEMDDETSTMPSAMPMPSEAVIEKEPEDTDVPVPPASVDATPSLGMTPFASPSESSPMAPPSESSPMASPSVSAPFASPSVSVMTPMPLVEEDIMPSESPESNDEVCVDAEYLAARGVPAHHLVHKEHVAAPRVLCPTANSLPCATADHMVRVAGKGAVSYEMYCAAQGVTCTEKRNVLVNSVLSHIWEERADEHAPGVTLTMLDARHPEMMQKMLHRFIALSRRLVQ